MNWTQSLGSLITGSERAGLDAEDLLNGLAMANAMRRAGSLPISDSPLELAPPDDLPSLDLGESQLRQCLDEAWQLVVEWCREAGKAGWRAPEAVLPDLLDYACTRPAVLDAVNGVLGERGRWLARQNPNWAALTSRHARPDLTLWAESSTADRLAMLRAAEPELRRTLLQSTWTQDPAKERRQYLQLVATEPHPSDQEWLLSLGKDRSHEVRKEAALALLKLGGNEAYDEAIQLLAEFVGRTSFDVRSPEGDDARFERFGIPSIKSAATPEQREARLADLLELIPPTVYVGTGLIEYLSSRRSRLPLLVAVLRAIESYQHQVAAREVLEKVPEAAVQVLRVLPHPEREKWAAHQLHATAPKLLFANLEALGLTEEPWSLGFSQYFADSAPLEGRHPYGVKVAAFYLHPDTRVNVNVPGLWLDTVATWERILGLRRSMLETIRRSPKP